mmetsp:Transcript_6782/g.23848  ORF Transcript_6782/g.23848 Transcript_6782/m.23848 type:complete len:131 (-) Transcript_6782:22-414(-)
MGGVRIASEAAGAQERRPETADRRSQPRTWQCGGVCVDAQVEEDEEEDEEEQEEEEGGIDMRGSNLNPAFLDSTEMRQILSNPRVVMQLQEMLSDPESMRNHLNNPEMLQILQAFNNHNLQYRPDDNEPA